VLHFTHKFFFEDSVLLAAPSDAHSYARSRPQKNDIFPRAVQEAQGTSAAVFVQFQLFYFTFAGCGRSYAQNIHVGACKLANACRAELQQANVGRQHAVVAY
jgi:hypothetical protein